MESESPVKTDSRPLSSASSSESLHSGVKSKPGAAIVASCPTCGKNFCSVGALKRHNISIHLKDQIYPCTVADCGKTFLLNEYLKKHLRRYHKLPPMFPRKRKSTSDLKSLKALVASAAASALKKDKSGLDSGSSSLEKGMVAGASPSSSPTKSPNESQAARKWIDSIVPLIGGGTSAANKRAAKGAARKKNSTSPAKSVRISTDESFSPGDFSLSDATSSPEKTPGGGGVAATPTSVGGGGGGGGGGKGKRRKQKKALVEGWMDPDELEDDFWLPPEDAKKTKTQEKRRTTEKTATATATAAAAAAAALNFSLSDVSPVSTPAAAATVTSTAAVVFPAPTVPPATVCTAAPAAPLAAGPIATPGTALAISPLGPKSRLSTQLSGGTAEPKRVAKPRKRAEKTLAQIRERTQPAINAPAPEKNAQETRKKKRAKAKTPPERKLLFLENRMSPLIERRRELDSPTPSVSGGGGGGGGGHSGGKSASKGPLIRVRGGNHDAPESVVIVNNPDSCAQVSNGNKPHVVVKSRNYAGPYVNEKIAKGLYNRPPTHFVLNYEDTHNWRCMLCGHGNFFDDLGQLFGPFHVAESKLNPIFKNSVISLCRESVASMSEAVVLSPRRSRIVSGTKGPVQGSKSPTRSAITSSGNIAQETDDSSAVTNPDPEPGEIWLHETCAVWSVGVYMVEGKIYGLEEALNVAAETKCSFCLENGASLGCFKSCNSNYHFHCAKKNCCQFNEENFTIRCPKHAETSVAVRAKEIVSILVH